MRWIHRFGIFEEYPLRLRIRGCRDEALSSLPDATSYEGDRMRMHYADAFCRRHLHVFVSAGSGQSECVVQRALRSRHARV